MISEEILQKKKIWENFLRVTDSENCDVKIIYDIHFGDSAESFFGEDVNIIKIINLQYL
jgi:hypothetical protein